MLTSLIIAFVILLLTFWYFQWKYQTKHLRRFPGPIPLPIIGNSLYFMNTSVILPNLLKLHRKYGGTCLLTIGLGSVNISVADPKFLEYVLGSTTLIDKSQEYKFLHNWLGTGLLTSTGIKWKNHRKILTPAFHFKILENFIEIFNVYSDILVEKLKPEINKDSINIYPFITLGSLDIICATAMGIKINAQEDSQSDYVYSVKEMCRITMERATSIIKMYDILYRFTKDNQIEQKAIKVLHNSTNSVINLRKEELRNKTKDAANDDADDEVIPEKKTFLDILLNYKEKYGGITDENIREEVDTFMFEGHDTTSSAVTFILYCLARNSDAQVKVMDELVRIFDNKFDRKITYKDLQEMKYLEMVIKESLRLYPSVPIYGRNVNENVEYDGTILPKGLTLMINAFCIHRDPNMYPNPDCFDPERFNKENHAKRSPYAYIPFSAGSRNCIGQKFAMLEMKAVVSKVLMNYELLPSVPEIELVLVSETILKSTTGVHIKLKQRNL